MVAHRGLADRLVQFELALVAHPDRSLSVGVKREEGKEIDNRQLINAMTECCEVAAENSYAYAISTLPLLWSKKTLTLTQQSLVFQ